MGNIKETQYFQAVQDKKVEVSDVLEQVYIALTEKGYNPVNQIVGILCLGILPILPATREPEALL
mgnify:CR=1 FL=1